MRQLFSVHDAARVLKVSSSTLYKYAEQKKIGFVKIGTALRFTEGHIESFIEDRMSVPAIGATSGRRS